MLTFPGSPVTLAEVLAARDRRCALQQELIQQYAAPIISFTLCIPGPVKRFPATSRAFDRGKAHIRQALRTLDAPILQWDAFQESTGSYLLAAVGADAAALKQAMVSIEDSHLQGRLYDMDVLGLDGIPLSRSALGHPPRRCLVCGLPGHLCARSRAHAPQDLHKAVTALLDG